jgi:hypothetical protein
MRLRRTRRHEERGFTGGFFCDGKEWFVLHYLFERR